MPDYSKTIIYKIVCKDNNITDIYIGHTTNIKSRKNEHKYSCNNINNKSYNSRVYNFIRNNDGWNNFNIIQIEDYLCENINEAKARERYWIEKLKPSLNFEIPLRTDKEYREDNKDKEKERQRIYRENNKDKVKEKQRIYRENNKDKIKERNRIYRENNKDKEKERHRIYNENNKDKLTRKNNC